MTDIRTAARHRYHLLALPAVTALVGVLIGLAITASGPVPGLVEPEAAVRFGLPIVRTILDSAAVVTIGLCLLPLLIGFDKSDLAEPLLAGSRRAAVGSALVWVVAALVALVLQTAELRPGNDVTLGAVVGYVATVGAGKALVLVAMIALIVTGLAVASVRLGESIPAELRAAAALFALLPLPVTGHAANWRWHDFSMISMELHVMASAAWTGGLGALVVVVAGQRPLMAAALPRFSRLATICLLVSGMTGLFNGVVQLLLIPDQDFVVGLLTTAYGQLVLLKVVCLGLLGALGATIRWRLLPAIVRHQRTALLRWATLELSVMGLAFGLAVVLTRAPVS